MDKIIVPFCSAAGQTEVTFAAFFKEDLSCLKNCSV